MTLSSTFLAKSTTPSPNTPPRAKVIPLIFSRTRLVRGSATMRPSVLLIAPTLGEMDIPLSFTIEDDVAVGVAGVVHALVGEAAGERAVAHDGDDLVLLALEIARGGHAERGGHRGAGVAGAELVVLALVPLEEAGDAVPLAQRRERLVAPGEELPGVGLVADVPHDLVGRGVELVEQRDGQLDHAEAGADVAAGDGAALDQAVADLLRRAGGAGRGGGA